MEPPLFSRCRFTIIRLQERRAETVQAMTRPRKGTCKHGYRMPIRTTPHLKIMDQGTSLVGARSEQMRAPQTRPKHASSNARQQMVHRHNLFPPCRRHNPPPMSREGYSRRYVYEGSKGARGLSEAERLLPRRLSGPGSSSHIYKLNLSDLVTSLT